ncbi:hypothetical protein DY000_02013751 [Brassica cretica]|uniref:Uncharacterized protein n=1 Tax=Brassica cretica TaxID=69181 RepID=A0ABQ7CWC6_BRACR|nr:hypothetical protein DY000_02013751 [Brassica cretica]
MLQPPPFTPDSRTSPTSSNSIDSCHTSTLITPPPPIASCVCLHSRPEKK